MKLEMGEWLLVLSLLIGCECYLEQRLIRRVYNYSGMIDLSKVDKGNAMKCEVNEFVHNSTYVSQICFKKDAFYNIETALGSDIVVMEMAIDLSSPWTWFKSKDCKACRVNPIEYDYGDSCPKKKSCFFDNFTKSYDSPKWQDVDKNVKIYSEDSMIMGQFQSDRLQFLGYNSSEGVSVGEYLAQKLQDQDPLKLMYVDGLRMVNVHTMVGVRNQFCDGSIGLGFTQMESDADESEPDTDFVEAVVKQKTSLELTRQQFAIYTRETGTYFPDYVIQFGGFDYKYAHYHSKDIVWIDRLAESGYYWMVSMVSICVKNLDMNMSEQRYLEVVDKRAMMTLSSQFLELPSDIIDEFMRGIESMYQETKCYLVDEDLYVVYCENIHFTRHLYTMGLSFRFTTLDKVEEVQLMGVSMLYQNCTQTTEDANLHNCILNVKLSRSNIVILGEPFMRYHYMIFENQPGNDVKRIGILPAATNMYYPDNQNLEEWPLLRLVLYVFITGVILMCCVTNCKRGLKDIWRAILYSRRQPTSNEDQSKLRVKQMDDEMTNDFEYEMQQQEKQKQQQWDQSNQQFNFSQKFEKQFIEDNSI